MVSEFPSTDGAGVGGGPSAALTYPEIVARYPNAWAERLGQATRDRRADSYNGEATIQSKAKLAKGYGGVMIWEITEDALAPRSLFKV